MTFPWKIIVRRKTLAERGYVPLNAGTRLAGEPLRYVKLRGVSR